MGYNAVLVVLTDRLNEIENDPEFGKKVVSAIRHRSAYGEADPPNNLAPYVTGQTQVVNVEHTDVTQIVAVGANSGRVIGRGHWRQSDDDLIRQLERQRREKAKEAKEQVAPDFTMTPSQIVLARHALGLPNDHKHSYRNRFVAGRDHPDYANWRVMVDRGYATRRDGSELPFGGNDLFTLTRKGAEAALIDKETLDPEDFPEKRIPQEA